jgi:HK97 family phage prohead protease
MPYDVRKSSSCPKSRPWALVKRTDGEIMGCHASKAAAERQRAAIEASESKEDTNMLKKQFAASFKALTAEDGATQPGTFEALVAVYDNVDRVGDRVKAGAFDDTLEAWRKSGDPIPIILAHQWDDPWKHIGFAMPEDVKSIPGRGLYVEKGILDIDDNPLARQVYRLMERRTLKEFSFGYSVPQGGERKADDGAYDLLNLNLIEFGPCLKGVNEETELLAVKAVLDEERQRETGAEPTLDDRLTRLEALVAGSAEGKAYAELAGSYEERQSAVRDAVQAAHSDPDNHIWAYVEGTSEDTVTFCVHSEEAEDEERRRVFYQASYTVDDEGNVDLGEVSEVELTVTVEPKAMEYTEALEAAYQEKAEREAAESKAEEPEAPEHETVDPGAKSEEINLMLHEQALAAFERELGIHTRDELASESEPEGKSADEIIAETEAEIAPPVPFDVGEVRLKQLSDELDGVGEIPEHPPEPEVEQPTPEERMAKAEKELTPPVPFDVGEIRRKQAEDMLDTTEAAHQDVFGVDQEVDDASKLIEKRLRELDS